MVKQFVVFVVILLFSSNIIAKQCENYFSLNELKVLKQNQFEITSDVKRNKTAINLLNCIGHPNPEIRDGLVFEATSHWLRKEKLETETVKEMFNTLIGLIAAQSLDENNFTQPFAALVLSEVVRVDRVSSYLNEKERELAVVTAVNYMNRIADYRGYDDAEGWRHAVAHTGDVFLQLALNKAVTKKQLDQMLSAILGQIVPQKNHFYIYGEPKRLAMPFAYIVLRGDHSEEELNNVLGKIANPAPFESWGDVYKSNNGLSKLHNTRSFIYSLYAITSKSENEYLKRIQPTLTKIIRQLG